MSATYPTVGKVANYPSKRPRKMDDRELVTVVEQQLWQTDTWRDSEARQMREQAWAVYFMRPRGDEKRGRSKFISGDVGDMVEAVLAEMLQTLTYDCMVHFEPSGEEDEAQAEVESLAVNDALLADNDGYIEFASAFKEALLLRNGFIKVWVEEQTEFTDQDAENVTEEDLTDIVMDLEGTAPNVDRVEIMDKADIGNGLYNARVRIYFKQDNLRISFIRRDQMFIWRDWIRPTLEHCPYVAERCVISRSDLVDAGIPLNLVMDLPTIQAETRWDTRARYRTERTSYITPDVMREMVETFKVYMRVDFDGDGHSELRYVWLAGGSMGQAESGKLAVLLKNEYADIVPYAAGVPLLTPGSFEGTGLYDKLFQIQDAKTSIWREWLDNTRSQNNPQKKVVPNLVEMVDLQHTRPDGFIRMKRMDAMEYVVAPDVGPSASLALQGLDKVRSERGGAALDLQAAELQLAGETAQGIERQYRSKEKLTQLMVTTMAQTLIKEVYKLAHSAMRSGIDRDIVIRSGGAYQQTNPKSWPTRKKCSVKAGLTTGQRIDRLTSLRTVLEAQMLAMEKGMNGELADASRIFNTLQDWVRTADLDSPERYFIDPTSPEATEAKKAKEQGAQQQQAMMSGQMRELQSLVGQLELEKQRRDQDFEQYKHETELRFKYFAEMLTAEKEEAQAIAKAAVDLAKQGETSGSGADVEAASGSRGAG